MIIPATSRVPRAGFVNHAFLSLVLFFFCAGFLFTAVSGLVLGTWPVRIAIAMLLIGLWLWMRWLDRREEEWRRMEPGQRVRVTLGPHKETLGTVVETLFNGHCVRVALDGDAPAPIDFQFWQLDKVPEQPSAA